MKKTAQGSAIVEMTLMMPWLFLLFICVLDFGFYAYAAICTQNAARFVAMYAAQQGAAVGPGQACQIAMGEMGWLPNLQVTVQTPNPCSGGPVSDPSPLAVSVRVLDATSTNPACADCALNSNATSAQATVTYRSIPLFAIPGVMMGRMNLTRIAEARIYNLP